MYAIHLDFCDGTTFFRRFKNSCELKRELQKWKKFYDIEGVQTRMGIFFGTAHAKR